jgi:uncharacterized membrane protein
MMNKNGALRIFMMVTVLAMVSGGVLWGADNAAQTRSPVVDTDLVIQLKDLSSTAQFYPVVIDGVKMEVLALKAPDGTYRTVFNTCQVCYASGRGYYKQSGQTLVCQNCGNRFPLSRVEVSSGGCNPVPIFAQYKTQDDEKITISRDFLIRAKAIFARWKA